MWTRTLSGHKAAMTAALGAALALISPAALCTAGIAVDDLAVEATADPGETYGGTIVVRNGGEDPSVARVYQTDYLFFSDGTNVYGDPGGLERSNAGWVTFGPRLVEILPGGSSAVEYSIAVPDDGSLEGTYWSLIMVEEVPGAQPGEPPGEMKAGVAQVLRYGVQVVTHVGDTGARTLRFAEKMLTVTADGDRMLHADVENTGERGLRPFLWVELYGSDGTRLGPYQTERKRLYPGTSVRYSVDLTEAPNGSYQAFVVVDNGDEYAFGAQYGLEF